MKITYIGHACFELTANDGTRVIMDPYDASVGIKMLPLEADLITMSHEHHDHNCEDMIVGAPKIVHGPELAQAGGVTVRAVPSWHDEAQGAQRGNNWVRIFTADGLKIVHMGDQGCMPDEDVLEAIADADVMMIPVGGFYTVDAAGAKAIVERAKPRCVIPMHFVTANGNYSKISDHRAFLDLMGVGGAQPVGEIELSEGNVPEGVLLMKPKADEVC